MIDRPEGKPIEHIGRIIRAEIRTKATPQQAYDAWARPGENRPLVSRPRGRKSRTRRDDHLDLRQV
jgi:hypothetical protein